MPCYGSDEEKGTGGGREKKTLGGIPCSFSDNINEEREKENAGKGGRR